MKIKKYIDHLASRGKYFFTTRDVKNELGLSDAAMWSSLSRLKNKGEVASPAKGYYVIVPLEYRSLGTLPPDQFIHHLMQHLSMPYYVGLLSAAQRYGAAHQQPQVFQVVVPKHHRPLKVGRIEVTFIVNKYLRETPTKEFNTPKGIIIYSTPEATSLDLINYVSHCGGLNNILTVLGELVEEMNIDLFKKVLIHAKETPPLQRLGYLFEQLGEGLFVEAIKDHLGQQYLPPVPLSTRHPNQQGHIYKKWHLIINT